MITQKLTVVNIKEWLPKKRNHSTFHWEEAIPWTVAPQQSRPLLHLDSIKLYENK